MSFNEYWADDLPTGLPLPASPAITISTGLAAAYQAVCGDSLRVPLSEPLARQVTGRTALANPGLVLQIAIGQSTVATRRVIANLFYRNVRLLHQVEIGATLTTTVTAVASALTSGGDRAKVLLLVTCTDQDERVVARFERLALLPVRAPTEFVSVGEVGTASSRLDLSVYEDIVPSDWRLDGLSAEPLPAAGAVRNDPLIEPVDDALSLVRLTQNLAAAHRDTRRGLNGRRLVYGGHTVGLAQAALSRADPGIATILGWHACNHVAPVFEGDDLRFDVTLTEAKSRSGGTVAAYEVNAYAMRQQESTHVLAWTPVVYTASTISNESGQRR